MSYFSDVERDLVVAGRVELADGVVAFDLVSHNGRDLPAWSPGSHIDVILEPGLERQYSLCGDRADRSRWRIAVLREPDGRGGSVRLHDTVEVGQRLRVRGPRSHFEFEVTPGTRYRFIAGGIGITPIRSMVEQAAAWESTEGVPVDWTLDYAGRSRSTMAFADELASAHPDRVRIHAAGEGDRLDLDALLGTVEPDVAVYACGPRRLIEHVEQLLEPWPDDALHVERFEAKQFGDPVWPDPFEVELALSGETVVVTPDQSVLEAIEAQAPDVIVLSSCRRGTCGTCEVAVLDGAVEHRDSVLTPAERAASEVMLACVSRAAGPRLTLDL